MASTGSRISCNTPSSHSKASRIRRLTTSIALSLLCITAQAAAPAPGQTEKQPAADSLQSAHDFVQGFYDWYVQLVEKNNNNWQMDSALKNKDWPMSEEIVTALNADFDAQAKSPDEIVGIDFDPFLAAQDTCFPYKARKVTKTGARYQVEVFGLGCSSPHPELATVIAVIEERKGKFVFVNFLYPDDTGGDLLSELKALKKERDTDPN